MVIPIQFTDFSKSKLQKIHRYYSDNVSSAVAAKLVQSIISSTKILATFPKSGKQELFYSDRYGVVRSVQYKSFKVLYVVQETRVSVVNIFDARRDPEVLSKEMIKLKM